MPNRTIQESQFEQMLIASAEKCGWRYMPADQIERPFDEVLVAPWLKEALVTLNPITAEQAEQVIYKLRTLLISVPKEQLIQNNNKFRKMLFEENSFPFGEDGQNINIRFFDELNPDNNLCVVTNQWMYPRASKDGGKRLDLVFIINGIPMVIGELKNPFRPDTNWGQAAQDIVSYQKSIPEMFVPNILCFACDGHDFRYGGVGLPAEKWGPWYDNEERDHSNLKALLTCYEHLLQPNRLWDIYRYYTVFTADTQGRTLKVVCRYQQYLGGDAIVQRVLSTTRQKEGPKSGLIWHFQGSGKSWLMVFVAQKLRKLNELHAPTVVIVDDRIDLEDQITGDFTRAEVPNLESAGSKEALERFFEQDQRKILITTIFKFGDVSKVLSERDNIIVLVDEAHRTQEKELGAKMRHALPNAFFFGLTGTPINRREHNTFVTFGAREDTNGYLSKYTFQNSVDDGATLQLNFQTVPVTMHLDKEKLQDEFDALTDEIDEEQRQQLVRRTSVEAFFTSPDRIQEVCRYIVKHFRETVEPSGMKAQVVVYNRECCVKYKKAIDTLLGRDDATVIVMHTDGDKADEYKEYQLSRDEQKRVLDQFRDPLSPLKFVIVTSKLLTGFDAPILQCMYLDKPMKDHTLLQAICRTNRKYTHDKLNGLIVDFVGVFDNVAKSLAFDEETIKTVVKNIDEIREQIPTFMDECLRFFPGVDRTLGDWEGLQAAQQCLREENKKTDFAKHFARLSRAWEIVSPDKSLETYQADYSWMAGVYQSIRPVTSGPSLIWTLLGAKTIEIIHNSIDSINIGTPLEDLVVNADIIDQAITEAEARKRTVELEHVLRLRLQTHAGDVNYKPFVEKLEELRERMEQSLETSIDFLKQLLELAKDLLKAEKKVVYDDPIDRRMQARAALTELFESIKTPETPIIVENVVNDIDTNIVAIVRKFSDAFRSVTAQREIKQKLRTILWIKYSLKDQEVFDKAYAYIEMYY
jgi:type I restriction enzyme R subunit